MSAAADRSPASKAAQHQLIEANLALVTHIAVRHAGRGLSVDDLLQEGRLAVVEAAIRFDPDKGSNFAAFAAKRVEGAIKDALRKDVMQQALIERHDGRDMLSHDDKEWDGPPLADYSCDPGEMIDPDDQSGRPQSVRDVRRLADLAGTSSSRDPYLMRRSGEFAKARKRLQAVLARRV